MTWIMLRDNWRDESSEGPYTATLQTFHDNNTGNEWSIVRLHGESRYTVELNQSKVKTFKSIGLAKAYVSKQVGVK
jgi:hypothetical protein